MWVTCVGVVLRQGEVADPVGRPVRLVRGEQHDDDGEPVGRHDPEKATPPERADRRTRRAGDGSLCERAEEQKAGQQEEQRDAEVETGQERSEGSAVQRASGVESGMRGYHREGGDRPDAVECCDVAHLPGRHVPRCALEGGHDCLANG